MHHYSVYGLRIASEFELIGAREIDSNPDPDVTVTLTKLDFPSARIEDGRYTSATADSALLVWESVGAFKISRGREILVSPRSGVPHSVVSLFITGASMGVLLHQRGLLVLHASAVSIADHVAAFIGFKGMGKSTTAAAMVGRGARLVSDDVLAMDSDILARPGSDLVKLWPGALSAALEDDPQDVPTLYPGIEKRAKILSGTVSDTLLPVGAIYVLDVGDDTSIENVNPSHAFVEVMRHAYAPRFVGTDGTTSSLFELCTSFVSKIPVFRLRRKPDLAELSSVAVAVESHFSDLLARNE